MPAPSKTSPIQSHSSWKTRHQQTQNNLEQSPLPCIIPSARPRPISPRSALPLRAQIGPPPPPYNGRTDFREWKRKLELIYDAKPLSDAHKLTWTLALLQEGASRVATHAAPTPTLS